MKPILRLGELLFRFRSWTPVPLAVWAATHARPRKRYVLPGLAATLIGLCVRLWAVAHLGPKSRTRRDDGPTRRVRSGPYAFLTHPLYVANGLISGGLIVASGAGWPWLQVFFPWIWFSQYGPIMLWEEENVRRRFGRVLKTNGARAAGEPPGWRLAWQSERRTRQGVVLFLGTALLASAIRLWRARRGGAAKT